MWAAQQNFLIQRRSVHAILMGEFRNNNKIGFICTYYIYRNANRTKEHSESLFLHNLNWILCPKLVLLLNMSPIREHPLSSSQYHLLMMLTLCIKESKIHSRFPLHCESITNHWTWICSDSLRRPFPWETCKSRDHLAALKHFKLGGYHYSINPSQLKSKIHTLLSQANRWKEE